MEFVFFIALFWIAPIFVGHVIGVGKGRAGWAWGLLLGWLGVIIVACLGPAPEMTLEKLEKQRGVMDPKFYEQKRGELLGARTHRDCPFCKEQMRRDASVCPHCRHESAAWKQHNGLWWVQVDGTWYWLDELANKWRKSAPAQSGKSAAAA